MADTITTNMVITLPEVGVKLDPTWATMLNTAFTVVDTHDHTNGKGMRIPTAGIDINADFPFNNFNATTLRASKYTSNAAVLPTSDVNAVYVSSGNLYYNNGSGTPIQITTGSNINVGAVAVNVLATREQNANLTIVGGDTFTLIAVDTSTTAYTITLPAASAVTIGRYYLIKDAKANAAVQNITVAPQGADTIDELASSKVISINNGALWFVSDGTSKWRTVGNIGATPTVPGVINLAGDLTGTAALPRVGKIGGVTVPQPVSVTTGNVLQANGALSATWAPVNLAGGTDYVTGLLPGTNMALSTVSTYGAIKLAGDFSSASTAAIPRIGSLTGTSGIVTCLGQMSLGAGLTYHHVIVTAGTYTVLSTDMVLRCQTSGGAITLTLPSDDTGQVIVIKDISGSANTNNITLDPPGAVTIDGLAGNRVLSANFGTWTFMTDSDGNFWSI